MAIKHHINDDLLWAYNNNRLEEGWALLIATHIAICNDCKKALHEMEQLSGALLEAVPAKPSDLSQSFAATMARLKELETGAIDESVDYESNKTSIAEYPKEGRILPLPLVQKLGHDIDGIKWKPLGVGAYHYPIETNDNTKVRLLKIPKGSAVPEHSHRGMELTLVLQGGFSDKISEFWPGDVQETDESIEHQPIAANDMDCICLAVTDAPLKFKSRLVRFLQPILGI